jgi:hypothetical protein
MTPVPFLMRFLSGWADIQNEVNDFAKRRRLPTYAQEPTKFSFHGWGSVGFPPRLACNLTIFYRGNGIEVRKRFSGQGNHPAEDQLLAFTRHAQMLVTTRWGSVDDAAAYLADSDAIGLYDPLTGLYWTSHSDRTAAFFTYLSRGDYKPTLYAGTINPGDS